MQLPSWGAEALGNASCSSFSQLCCSHSNLFSVTQPCCIRDDFEPEQQGCVGAERLQSLLVHFKPWFLSLSQILLYLLWPGCETSLEWFSRLWSGVSSLLLSQAAPPLASAGAVLEEGLRYSLAKKWNVWLRPINAFCYYGFKLMDQSGIKQGRIL